MYRIVPFVVICPDCRGNKYIVDRNVGAGNTTTGYEMPCYACKKRGIIQTGRVRTDKLPFLYKRIESPRLICYMCKGSGVRDDASGKPCKACRGLRINILSVVLEFKEGPATLYDYLTRDE